MQITVYHIVALGSNKETKSLSKKPKPRKNIFANESSVNFLTKKVFQ